MRHQRTGRKLGRDSAHRKSLHANLVCSLIEHGRIQTTEAKAKEVRPIAEGLITLGRRGDLAAHRHAVAFLRSKPVVHKLFAEPSVAVSCNLRTTPVSATAYLPTVHSCGSSHSATRVPRTVTMTTKAMPQNDQELFMNRLSDSLEQRLHHIENPAEHLRMSGRRDASW